ncbi:MAG: 50S ribosomal protein L29 [Verrucomicrobia bacterium]|nr:50S ribosomal protein L29 [Verrucomicrobiota bacterium]
MAKKKKEIVDLSIDELKAKAADLDREIFDMRNELALNRKIEKPHLIKSKKKEKARILTIMTQKQRVVA